MTSFTSTADLLQSVESHSHHDRCKALVEVGRSSLHSTAEASAVAATPAVNGSSLHRIICELGTTSQLPYQRMLSAYAIRGVFAESIVLSTPIPDEICATAIALLQDPSEKVAQVVMTPLLLAHRSGTPALPSTFSPSSFLVSARLPQFKSFATKMYACGQQDTLVSLFQSRSVTDPKKRQILLGMLSPSEFEALPLEEQALLDRPALRLLCHHHGDWVAQFLARRVKSQIAEANTVDALLRQHVLSAYAFLSTARGNRHALNLFVATAHHLSLNRGEVNTLLTKYFLYVFPREVGTYLLDGEGRKMVDTMGRPLKLNFTRHSSKRLAEETDLVMRLMDKNIVRFAAQGNRFVPRDARQREYDAQRARFADENGLLDASVVESIPRVEDRVKEARFHIAHVKLQDEPYQRIRFLQFLAFPEAAKLGDAFITSNDANIRLSAIGMLLKTLRYFPEHVDAALEFCLKRTKEQDPWRAAMFEAWGDLPFGFWKASATALTQDVLCDKLALLIEAAYSAKDLSDNTLSNVQQFFCRLMGLLPEFALPRLIKLLGRQKTYCESAEAFDYVATYYPDVLPRLVRELLHNAEKLLENDASYDYAKQLEALLAKDCAHLLRVLFRRPDAEDIKEAIKKPLRAGLVSSDNYSALAAINHYSRVFPSDMRAEVPALLEKNLDWITQNQVQRIVCNVLQGPLLDRFIVPIKNIPSGRFYQSDNGNALYVCQLPLSFAYRWTAQQQRQYAESILSVVYATKTNVDLFTVRNLVSALGRLPSVPSTAEWRSPSGESYSLLTLATTDHPEHGNYLKGFALQALGQRDGDAAAVAALQTALEAPATRMDALRALSRTLRRASTTEAIGVLNPLLTGLQVTAQKESLYLLGSKNDAEAYERLVQFAAERNLPMPADGEIENDVLELPPSTAKLSEEQTKMTMHRDVRTAFVATLFRFLDRPQVWAYFERLLRWDCTMEADDVAPTEEVDEEEEVEEKEEENEEVEEKAEESEEDTKGAHKEKPCLSFAACEAMTNLSWSDIRLPWQLANYQHLLTGLLKHPKRSVRISALRKLATVPPYASLDLCKDVSAYLDNCENPQLVRATLQCMMSCTAEETAPYVVSAILNVEADPSLKIIVEALTRLTTTADTHVQPKYYAVADGVVSQLTAARRQPTLVVQLIYALPLSQLVQNLTALMNADLLHIGAAYTAVEQVHNNAGRGGGGGAVGDLEKAELLELTVLREHNSPVLRRVGLEIVVQARNRKGWTDERRAAVAAYQRDADLWVSSDAAVVRLS